MSTQDKLKYKLKTVVIQYNYLQNYISDRRPGKLHVQLAEKEAFRLKRTYGTLIKYIDLTDNEHRKN